MNIHYVYKIMNLVNGKFYIGKHSSDNIDDDYYGSGHMIKKAIDKYGREYFSKSIIKICESESSAYEFEAGIVTQELLDSKMCYNLRLGGIGMRGGDDHPRYCSKVVIQLEKGTYNVIDIFPSCKEAAIAVGGSLSGISDVARGVRTTSQGSIWRYANYNFKSFNEKIW